MDTFETILINIALSHKLKTVPLLKCPEYISKGSNGI